MNEEHEERRYILYHKHHASARTRFICFDNKTVLFPESLPALAQHSEESVSDAEVVEAHPTMLMQQLAGLLEVDAKELELDAEYDERVETAKQLERIRLVRFTTIDPPFELAERLNGRFIDLTQARHLPDTELILLRRAYEVIMEG